MPPALSYSAPFFLSAALVFVVALFCFARRQRRGAWYLTLTLLMGGLWAASEGALYLGLDMHVNLTITYLQYLAVAPLTALALLFALEVFGYDRWIKPVRRFFLYVLAPVMVLLAWSDPWHHWMYPQRFLIDTGPVPMLGLTHGPLWWGLIAYQYLLLTLLAVVLVRQAIVSARMGRAQALVILVALAVVWLLNAIYVSGHSPVPNMDIGPLAFILVALSMAWGFFRYNLLEVLPIAKTEIFYSLNLPILVVDEQDRIVEINPMAEAMLDVAAKRSAGRPLAEILGNHPGLGDLSAESGSTEVRLTLAGRERFFEARVSTLRRNQKERVGRVIVLQEVTALRESERLQGVLEMAGAVCHGLSQPVMAIEGYADLAAMNTSPDDPNYKLIQKIVDQAKKLSEMNQRLVRITRYETRPYMGGSIVDIAKSSSEDSA